MADVVWWLHAAALQYPNRRISTAWSAFAASTFAAVLGASSSASQVSWTIGELRRFVLHRRADILLLNGLVAGVDPHCHHYVLPKLRLKLKLR